MAALLLIPILLLVGLIAYLTYYFKQKRIKALAALAQQLSLQFARADPFGTLSQPFQLFRKGDGRGVENVLWGTWQGLELRQFDFWYYDESTDSKGNTSRTYYRFNCVMCPVQASCADLTIDHENMWTRLADALSFHDIEFESEDFNKRYQVKCSNEKFANDFIDARMIEWLLKNGTGFSFEVSGDEMLVVHKRLKPAELMPLLQAAGGFAQAVPRVVFELYPKG